MKLKDYLNDKILDSNEASLNALKSIVKTGNVTWILGAGISVPAGLPKWKDLLTKMWTRLSEIEPRGDRKDNAYMLARRGKLNQINDYSKFRSKAKNAYDGKGKNIFKDINVLESAEYMWNYIDDLIGDNVESVIKLKLKKQILKAILRESLSTDITSKELAVNLENETIGVLVKIIAAQKCGKIITYNFDNILEMCFQEIAHLTKDKISVVCDCDMDKSDKEGKINIHHPHGVLKVIETDMGKESENIVLTESSYYEMERKAYNWENSVQAKALVETSCIFIGFSGDDYNFRRIIKNIGFNPEREKPAHYIFICLDNLIGNIYGEDPTKYNSEEFLYENLQLINRLYAQYSYWENHGIIPVWTTFEELPVMLRQMSES